VTAQAEAILNAARGGASMRKRCDGLCSAFASSARIHRHALQSRHQQPLGRQLQGTHTMITTRILAAALLACSTAAMAGPTCTAPQDKWMKETDFKKGLENKGYQIKTFKVSKGQCYEIYGFDRSGKKVEIYFDPVTAAVVEAK
jgi:hypothetical protein